MPVVPVVPGVVVPGVVPGVVEPVAASVGVVGCAAEFVSVVLVDASPAAAGCDCDAQAVASAAARVRIPNEKMAREDDRDIEDLILRSLIRDDWQCEANIAAAVGLDRVFFTRSRGSAS